MSNNLFNSLTEEFGDHAGQLIGYVDINNAGVTPFKHYNLRSFHGDNITVPQTMLDMRYQSIGSFDTVQMIVMDSPRSVIGRSIAARTMTQIDLLNNSQLDIMTQGDLDLYNIASGNENWNVGGTITVGKDSSLRYGNSLQVVLTGGVTQNVTSSFRDNIFADFPNDGSTYYLELVLPSFPAQGGAFYIDLTNSFIDISSDSSGSYALGMTDSLSFASTLNSVSAGGNTFLRWNRNSLVNSTLSNITNIRLRLKSIGNMTFKAQSLRLVPSTYSFPVADVDTKRNTLRRVTRENAGTEPTTKLGPYFLNSARPKNGTFVAKFNSGHMDASNPNVLTFYTRHSDVNNNISFTLNSLSASTTAVITTTKLGGATVNYNAVIGTGGLATETDYYLIIEQYEDQQRMSIYRSYGGSYGDLFGTTDWMSTALIQRGHLGYAFNPYNYDFTIDYIMPADAEFGRFESKNFTSIKSITSATLATQDKNPIDLTAGRFIAAGDATVSTDGTIGLPAPSTKIVRDGTNFQGGYQTDTYLYIGNPRYLKISGDLFPVLGTGQSTLRGQFRVVFLDKWGSVGHIEIIRNLLPSQWNHFEIPLSVGTMAAGNYQILIQQTGFFADTFYFDNLSVSHLSVAYEASTDNGLSWFPWLTAINGPYTGINIIGDSSPNLKIRAIALADTAWISNYELIPTYGFSSGIIRGTYDLGTYGTGTYG